MAEKDSFSNGYNESLDDQYKSGGIIARLKEFSPITWIGIILTALFIIFSFIPPLNYRWHIMLPIFIIGAYLLYTQKNKVVSLEKAVVTTFFWVLIAYFLLRDGMLSNEIAKLTNILKQVGALK
ncbi:MAG: hypothetical protein SVN78_05190 [Deferribacterota bacterium]|nr:hypothetical protein [Deferribacterota bacterium]